MDTDPLTVSPDTELREVATLMADKDVNRLPVVDDEGRVVGVVARGDVCELLPPCKAQPARKGSGGNLATVGPSRRPWPKERFAGRLAKLHKSQRSNRPATAASAPRPAAGSAPGRCLSALVRLLLRSEGRTIGQDVFGRSFSSSSTRYSSTFGSDSSKRAGRSGNNDKAQRSARGARRRRRLWCLPYPRLSRRCRRSGAQSKAEATEPGWWGERYATLRSVALPQT